MHACIGHDTYQFPASVCARRTSSNVQASLIRLQLAVVVAPRDMYAFPQVSHSDTINLSNKLWGYLVQSRSGGCNPFAGNVLFLCPITHRGLSRAIIARDVLRDRQRLRVEYADCVATLSTAKRSAACGWNARKLSDFVGDDDMQSEC